MMSTFFSHKVIFRVYIHSLEKAMAPHSSTLAWKIPWMEEPGGLQSMGSLRVGHDWTTSLSLFTSCIGEGNGNPLQCSCLENPRDGGPWWAAVYGVAQSRTRLKWLSSSSGILTLIFLFWTYFFVNSTRNQLSLAPSPFILAEFLCPHFKFSRLLPSKLPLFFLHLIWRI